MSWGDFARTDYASDQAGRTARGDYLVERDVIVTTRPFDIGYFAEFSTASATFQDAHSGTTLSVRTPDYAAAGWFLHGRLYVKVAAGSGGEIRLQNVTDSNDGTAQTGIDSASYIWSDDISVQVDAGPHALVQIKVQVRDSAATNLMYVKNTDGGYVYGTFYWASS